VRVLHAKPPPAIGQATEAPSPPPAISSAADSSLLAWPSEGLAPVSLPFALPPACTAPVADPVSPSSFLNCGYGMGHVVLLRRLTLGLILQRLCTVVIM
jgi:hypothetical protein